MAQNQEESRVPVLVSPREETVLDGRRVSFTWKPVQGAVEYRLQVSETPSFDSIVFEGTVSGRTEYVLEHDLSLDNRTYYWRVVVRDEEGHLHGEDTIESFISGTPADEDLQLESPDDKEEFGPAAELLRGAAVEAASEFSDDPRLHEEAEALGVEGEGIEAGQILGFILATLVAIGLAIFALYNYMDIVAAETRFEVTGSSGYPELREAELRATQQLSQYGVVDEAEGIYRIPIDEAIDIMADEAQEGEGDYSDELDLQVEEK